MVDFPKVYDSVRADGPVPTTMANLIPDFVLLIDAVHLVPAHMEVKYPGESGART